MSAASAGAGALPPVPANCVVTGGSGFVGQRLVEMLVERGAARVVSFDIAPPPRDALDDARVEYVVGDISKLEDVEQACKSADCVWHVAAAVGPYHPAELYLAVNHRGTLNVVEACKRVGCRKIVMSSSPSTRFDGSDLDGVSEDELPELPMRSYLQEYAESKALGELALRHACCSELMTVAVAPHQVYGPRDTLFLTNVLEAAGLGRLRVFGRGRNRICFSYVDNYCHALIIAERALRPGSAALGGFYIVTDGETHTYAEGYDYFWEVLDRAIVAMGFPSITRKLHLPEWLLYALAHLSQWAGRLLGVKFKLNPFAVRAATMHRWFKIDRARRDLGYSPIVPYAEGWRRTHEWFREHWLPTFDPDAGMRIAQQTRTKIGHQERTAASTQ